MSATRQLAAEIGGTLLVVGEDLSSLLDPECVVPWPDAIELKLREREALAVAMKWARERMSSDQVALVKGVYRDAMAEACAPSEGMPVTPLLPETLRRVDEALELLRRARALDRELDQECVREQAR